jgi:hypothetical protein
MSNKDQSSASSFKALGAFAGSGAFLGGSLSLAWKARQYQISGQPMPNGKGGFMTCGDGYLLALALLLGAVVWALQARKFSRATGV